jgi:AcrR family transcriptional regulator
MGGVTSRPQSAARRKPPSERRADIVDAASAIAVEEGLEKVTARRVADALGVFPGLINHYFASADDLVAEAFAHAATAERASILGRALVEERPPVERMRNVLAAWLHTDRDAISLLWLDAWQASRRRPALLHEVERQMAADLEQLTRLVDDGRASGQFTVDCAGDVAMQILSLVDGLSIQAAIRATLDYGIVRTMVTTTTARLLGLEDPNALSVDSA